jgi:hypothetical protein
MAVPATPAHKAGVPGVFATPAVPSPFPQNHPNRQQPQRAAAEVLLKPWSARPTRNLSFINAKLIDPKDGAIHEHVRLDIREGRIERMLKLTAPVTQPPSEAELVALKRDNIVLVDLAGKFVIPGLIDCHVHLATPPGEDGLKVRSSIEFLSALPLCYYPQMIPFRLCVVILFLTTVSSSGHTQPRSHNFSTQTALSRT